MRSTKNANCEGTKGGEKPKEEKKTQRKNFWDDQTGEEKQK